MKKHWLDYIPFVSLVVAVLGALVAYRTFEWNTIAQNAPKLEVSQIHMWNMGQGTALDPDNQTPTLKPGQRVEGTAFVVNVGGTRAQIIGSDIVSVWRPRFNMFNPGWNNPGQSKLQSFIFIKERKYITTGEVKALEPGENARWEFHSTVPENPDGLTLFLVGNVTYRDANNLLHGTYFVRRYDPTQERFIKEECAGDSERSF